MKERTLFPVGPGTGNLNTKQALVFTYLQENPTGKRAFDVGRFLHMNQPNPCWFCADDRTCQYAARDSNAILESLRGHSKDPHARKLVTRRADGRWYSVVPVERDTGTFPSDY